MPPPPPPEQYHVHAPVPGVPNSRFPVLVYRSALPLTAAAPAAESARAAIEANRWAYGGTFKTYWRCHFHSVTHECYAVVSGGSGVRVGVGPGDAGRGGTEVRLGRGDVIVLPAGVSHCSISAEGDYEYLGLYPEGSPKYDNNFCKAGAEETRMKAETARKVPVPEWDPIFGFKGPLYEIWSRACCQED